MEIKPLEIPAEVFAPEYRQQLHEQDPVKYPPLDEESTKKVKRGRVVAKHADLAEKAFANLPSWIRDCWPIMVIEADKWLTDNNAATPMLTAIANRRHLSVAEVVSEMWTWEPQLRTDLGDLIGKQMKGMEEIG